MRTARFLGATLLAAASLMMANTNAYAQSHRGANDGRGRSSVQSSGYSRSSSSSSGYSRSSAPSQSRSSAGYNHSSSGAQRSQSSSYRPSSGSSSGYSQRSVSQSSGYRPSQPQAQRPVSSVAQRPAQRPVSAPVAHRPAQGATYRPAPAANRPGAAAHHPAPAHRPAPVHHGPAHHGPAPVHHHAPAHLHHSHLAHHHFCAVRPRPAFGVRFWRDPLWVSPVVVYVGNRSYFYDAGVFFVNRAGNTYESIVPPVGAIVPAIPEDYRLVYIDNIEYYLVDTTLYEYIEYNGQTGFRVVGQLTC